MIRSERYQRERGRDVGDEVVIDVDSVKIGKERKGRVDGGESSWLREEKNQSQHACF